MKDFFLYKYKIEKHDVLEKFFKIYFYLFFWNLF